MHLSFDVTQPLEQALKAAAPAAGLDPASFSPEVRTADPRHGDFQANGVLAEAKRLGVPPRTLAEKLVQGLGADVRALAEVSVAGPGFINFRFKPAALLGWLRSQSDRGVFLAGASGAHRGQT